MFSSFWKMNIWIQFSEKFYSPQSIPHLSPKKLSDAVMHMRRPNYRTCGVKMRMEIESIEEGFFFILNHVNYT